MMFVQRLLYSIYRYFKPRHSRTVRYAFPLVFSAIAVLGAAVLLSQDTSYIRITATDTEVSAGETFAVDVYAGAAVPVNAIDIAVEFPKNQIEVRGIDTGESVITIWTQDPYVEGNQVILRGGTFRKGFLGEHRIATINARALQSGTAKFTVGQKQFLAGDGRGSTVTIVDEGYESLTMYVGLSAPAAGEEGGTTLGGTVAVGIYTDINGDGNVDMNDILSFMQAWQSGNTSFDFNNDGRMTFVDFAIILADSFFR